MEHVSRALWLGVYLLPGAPFFLRVILHQPKRQQRSCFFSKQLESSQLAIAIVPATRYTFTLYIYVCQFLGTVTITYIVFDGFDPSTTIDPLESLIALAISSIHKYDSSPSLAAAIYTHTMPYSHRALASFGGRQLSIHIPHILYRANKYPELALITSTAAMAPFANCDVAIAGTFKGRKQGTYTLHSPMPQY